MNATPDTLVERLTAYRADWHARMGDVAVLDEAIATLSSKGRGEEHPLAKMVALDEEIEAEHPGWMTGRGEAPEPCSHVARQGEMACPQIAMGHGKVDVGVIHWQGRTGLLLRPRDHVIPIGDDGEIAGDYWPTADDVVIWIDQPSGADVILSELAPLGTAQSTQAVAAGSRPVDKPA